MKADRAHFFAGFFKDFYGRSGKKKSVSDAVLDASWTTAMMAG